MKKPLPIFLIALFLLALTSTAFSYPADVTDISGAKYFPAVKDAISKATKSIYVVMFTVESSLSKPGSKPNQLIGALIEAKKRGLDVEVILDQNIDFVQHRPTGGSETKIKSTRAYKRLKEAGVEVYYDEPERYAHAKAVIIDKKIVIVGSTNWTEAAFDNNIETNVLANSEALAGEILGYLTTITIDENMEKYLDTIGRSTQISWEFMENPKFAPLMVKGQAERAFDVYLYLLWKFDGNPEGKLTLFYDDLAKYLGIYEGWTITDYRRQIIKVFRKLEQQYKLIKFEPRYAKEAAITLLNEGKGDDFEIPNAYFELGWNRILSFRAKFCYLINLDNADASDIKPFWSNSVAAITRQFGGIGEDIVSKGMGELRRRKLIEVIYDELSGKRYEARMPNMYKILPLYDPRELELKLKAVEEQYGKNVYSRAKNYAAIVFEENNLEVIVDIILKTKQYGEKKVREAFAIVARKDIDNPKRNYGYAKAIIEK